MSSINKKIWDIIENSDVKQDMKTFLKSLLMVELRNMADKKAQYSREYDHIILTHVESREKGGDQQ